MLILETPAFMRGEYVMSMSCKNLLKALETIFLLTLIYFNLDSTFKISQLVNLNMISYFYSAFLGYRHGR